MKKIRIEKNITVPVCRQALIARIRSIKRSLRDDTIGLEDWARELGVLREEECFATVDDICELDKFLDEFVG